MNEDHMYIYSDQQYLVIEVDSAQFDLVVDHVEPGTDPNIKQLDASNVTYLETLWGIELVRGYVKIRVVLV